MLKRVGASVFNGMMADRPLTSTNEEVERMTRQPDPAG